MGQAKSEIGKVLGRLVPKSVIQEVTKHLLAWWDRQVVETLTGERTEALHAEEVRAEIVRRAAILLENGFFEDTETYYGEIEASAPSVMHQLDFINATRSQRDRSVPIEDDSTGTAGGIDNRKPTCQRRSRYATTTRY